MMIPHALLMLFSWNSPALAQQGMVVVEENKDSNAENVHIIAPGDTLWSIANSFYKGNPQQWPTLWSYNEEITNPHWIYPGNRIVFSLGSLLDLPEVELVTENTTLDPTNPIEESVGSCGPDVRFNFKQAPATFVVSGFVKDPQYVDVLGVVEKSPHNRATLTNEDLIYIKVEDKNDYPCGEVLTVFRKIKNRVGHPDDGLFRSTNYGAMYRIIGEVVVTYTPQAGNYVTAKIRNSWSELQRGDLVSNKRDVVIQNEVAVPQGQTTGTIVDRLGVEHTLNTTRHILFIDKGSTDGVKKGDTFYVIKRRDEFFREKKDDPLLPASVIGRVMVVEVEETSSTVVVTDARQPIDIGDQISQNLD